ncbi:hypothetical protein [Xenorhabdus bovienii]|uniref:hypothetical protein n=1 Tax=Xenorhabdus bovienii TaxID=40576 RepID=UPI0023B23486|nr:hypothetical protein [Xenorhabdus bovienii]MDE9542946.1 hypothetical protein [Xenorhabdus bovienii]
MDMSTILRNSSILNGLSSTSEVKAASIQSPSEFARSWQGQGEYPGVDRFKDITVKKDTILMAGAPGQGNFYTTVSAIERSGFSQEGVFKGLQVMPHPQFGYRPGMTAYRVLEDTPAAFGIVRANPQHGAGGSCIQYVYCEFYCVEPIAAYNTKITL